MRVAKWHPIPLPPPHHEPTADHRETAKTAANRFRDVSDGAFFERPETLKTGAWNRKKLSNSRGLDRKR